MNKNKTNSNKAIQAYNHALTFGIDPNLELIIATDPTASYLYAKNVLKARFLLAEPIIAISSFRADYAQYVIKGRFKIFENNMRVFNSVGIQFHFRDFFVYTKNILNFNHN